MRDTGGFAELGWHFGASTTSPENSVIAGFDAGVDDEKLNFGSVCSIIANTAFALALCIAVHWAALSWF